MRAVLDPNVLVSALLSPAGKPAAVLRAWLNGECELVVSPLTIAELQRVFDYPKLRSRINQADSTAFIALLLRSAAQAADPLDEPAFRAKDPGDDYLIALAQSDRAVLVSGDNHLLVLAAKGLPIYSPADFLALLEQRPKA